MSIPKRFIKEGFVSAPVVLLSISPVLLKRALALATIAPSYIHIISVVISLLGCQALFSDNSVSLPHKLFLALLIALCLVVQNQLLVSQHKELGKHRFRVGSLLGKRALDMRDEFMCRQIKRYIKHVEDNFFTLTLVHGVTLVVMGILFEFMYFHSPDSRAGIEIMASAFALYGLLTLMFFWIGNVVGHSVARKLEPQHYSDVKRCPHTWYVAARELRFDERWEDSSMFCLR